MNTSFGNNVKLGLYYIADISCTVRDLEMLGSMTAQPKMTIRVKLEQYDLFDQAITKHGMLENIRDYELLGHLNGQTIEQEVRYIFKGCIKVEFQNIVEPQHFSMDERLLDMNRQDEPDYPSGFVWGVNYATVYPGWTLTENSEELTELEHQYGFSLNKIEFDTNAYKLCLIFHELETELVMQTEKDAPQHGV